MDRSLPSIPGRRNGMCKKHRGLRPLGELVRQDSVCVLLARASSKGQDGRKKEESNTWFQAEYGGGIGGEKLYTGQGLSCT